jgi:hypothetical protein
MDDDDDDEKVRGSSTSEISENPGLLGGISRAKLYLAPSVSKQISSCLGFEIEENRLGQHLESLKASVLKSTKYWWKDEKNSKSISKSKLSTSVSPSS